MNRLPLAVWLVAFLLLSFLLSMAMRLAGVPQWLNTCWSIVAGFSFGRALARELWRRAQERNGR